MLQQTLRQQTHKAHHMQRNVYVLHPRYRVDQTIGTIFVRLNFIKY